jgi:hypothetical protein
MIFGNITILQIQSLINGHIIFGSERRGNLILWGRQVGFVLNIHSAKKSQSDHPTGCRSLLSLRYFAFASNPASEYSITNPYRQVKKKHPFAVIKEIGIIPYLSIKTRESKPEIDFSIFQSPYRAATDL